jgi:hypothetical protein
VRYIGKFGEFCRIKILSHIPIVHKKTRLDGGFFYQIEI